MRQGGRARTLGEQLEIAGPPPTTKSFKADGSMPPEEGGCRDDEILRFPIARLLRVSHMPNPTFLTADEAAGAAQAHVWMAPAWQEKM
jgi:hypothetical protein